MTPRWFAPLLKNPLGATRFVRTSFPKTTFFLEQRVTRDNNLIRQIRFDLDGKTILRGRAIIDLDKTDPRIVRILLHTKKPIGEILTQYPARRTRLRATTRSREFHFHGGLHAKVWERFYLLAK
ncbi:MAG: hypothetical protein Q8P05_00015 [Candidatus Diapherotrites archaeon]|nr:hypothetical protein [Candidatus Diapherotrites archaeon]MDZ4256072.1 hypothetical protein [archaeon]